MGGWKQRWSPVVECSHHPGEHHRLDLFERRLAVRVDTRTEFVGCRLRVPTRVTDGDAADHFAVVEATDALPSVTLLVVGAVFAAAFSLVGLFLVGQVALSFVAG